MSDALWYKCPCGLRVSGHSMHFRTCGKVRELAERFTEDEYKANPADVIAFAEQNGRAMVVREDGSVRVVISIPKAVEPLVPPPAMLHREVMERTISLDSSEGSVVPPTHPGTVSEVPGSSPEEPEDDHYVKAAEAWLKGWQDYLDIERKP